MSEGYNEKLILGELAKGDQCAYTKLWKRHHARVYRYALRFLHSADEASEATQDVFLAVWMYRRHLVNVENFDTYLFSIKKNAVTKRLIALSKKFVSESEYATRVPLSESSSDFSIRDIEINEAFHLAMNSLPPQQRKVFEMAKEHDMSYEQIADDLNISENTVKFHVKEAFRSLRQHMKSFASVALLLGVAHPLIQLLD